MVQYELWLGSGSALAWLLARLYGSALWLLYGTIVQYPIDVDIKVIILDIWNTKVGILSNADTPCSGQKLII